MTRTQRVFMWIGIANTIVFGHKVLESLARTAARDLANAAENDRIARATRTV